jgi:deoxyribodipyrimidine photolyase-related protein
MTKNLIVILGDQLNIKISSLIGFDKKVDTILLCEVLEEATYVKHHKKKLVFIFSAMRHFRDLLEKSGFSVSYVKLDDPGNTGSFAGEVKRAKNEYNPNKIIITEPGEYRVLDDVKTWERNLDLTVEILADDRFLTSQEEFSTWADGRKELRMEYFYRQVRKNYNILMDGEKPEGGKWNYDNENRKPLKGNLIIPKIFLSEPDSITQEVMSLISKRFPDNFGNIKPFHYAVTRDQALQALEKFINERLVNFGTYQDAMVQGEPWLFHSHISLYLNSGLLLPLECVEHAEQAYRNGHAPLNSVEGFIRQIIGWREYIRGIYWLKMPQYKRQNFLDAERKLPEFFWGGTTSMNCLKQCINETKSNAYAHHIQRLMVLGNFSLIAGLKPTDVNEWYMIVYLDAFEWVELPNVTGMILFADGGLLASKPYAASGSYINKMSDYCKNCTYKVREKNGENACPFNYLYWDFLIRNKDKLQNNHRLSLIYKSLERMDDNKIKLIQSDSRKFFKSLDEGKNI